MKKYILFVLVAFFVACKADVNNIKKIDAQEPKVKLLFPKEECPVIKNSFTIRGIATDDDDVKDVNLILRYGSSDAKGFVKFPCSIEKKAGICQWKVVLNLPNKEGEFPLKDGKYFLEIVAEDVNGKEGRIFSSIIIDNTPPLLFLKSPFFKNGNRENVLFQSGSSINLKGVVADDSKIARLDFSAYSNGVWEEMSVKDVESTFDIKLDDFFENTNKGATLYKKIYGKDENAGEKKIPFAIRIFDCAKEYESPTPKPDGELGNKSDVFYVYEALEERHVEKEAAAFPKFSPLDVYHMLNGTFFSETGKDTDLERKKEAGRVLGLLQGGREGKCRFERGGELPLNLLEKDEAVFPKFSLNPLQNPTFEVTELLPKALSFEHINLQEEIKNGVNSVFNVSEKNIKKIGDVLSVKLLPYSENIALEDSNNFQFFYCDLFTFIKFYIENKTFLEPYNSMFSKAVAKSSSESGIVRIENVAIKKEKNAYIAYLPIDASLKRGGTYIIFAKGRDRAGNQFIPKRENAEKSSNKYLAYVFRIAGEVQEKNIFSDNEEYSFILEDVPHIVSTFPAIKGRFLDRNQPSDVLGFKAWLSYNGEKKREIPLEMLGEREWKLGNFEHEREGLYQFIFTTKNKEEKEVTLRTMSFEYDREEPILMKISDVSREELRNGKRLELKYFSDINAIGIGGVIKESNGIKEIKIGIKELSGEDIYKDFSIKAPKALSGSIELYSFFEKIDFKKEGHFTIIVKILDMAGREALYEVPTLVDKSSPNFESIKIGSKEFNNFERPEMLEFNSLSVPIFCIAKDEGVGVEKLEIYRERVQEDSILGTLMPISNNEGEHSVFQDVLNLENGVNQLIFILRDGLGHQARWTCSIRTSISSLSLGSENAKGDFSNLFKNKQKNKS